MTVYPFNWCSPHMTTLSKVQTSLGHSQLKEGMRLSISWRWWTGWPGFLTLSWWSRHPPTLPSTRFGLGWSIMDKSRRFIAIGDLRLPHRTSEKFCENHDIVLKITAGSHQSSNGLVERCIQTYANRLRKLSFSTGQSWQSIWKDVRINYNETHTVSLDAPQRSWCIESSTAGCQTMSEAELVEARAAAVKKTKGQREYEQYCRKNNNMEDKIEIGDQVLLYIRIVEVTIRCRCHGRQDTWSSTSFTVITSKSRKRLGGPS